MENNFDIKALKTQVKESFKQGKVPQTLKKLETDVLQAARATDDDFNVLEALIMYARIEMECGFFPLADKHLQEVNSILSEKYSALDTRDSERVFKLSCKFKHINTKNLIRSMYLQKGKDVLDKEIPYLENPEVKHDKIRLKYLCKLYEAMAHLLCDPYLFDQAEAYINKAEEIYLKNEELLEKQLYRKFLMKKSSFLKKFGFFIEALAILKDLENELKEMLKKPEGKSISLKKELFKAYRDQARLYGLRRQEKQALDAQSNAEKILSEIFIGITSNVKTAKTQLIKGLWMTKFDLDKSIDELLDSYHQFDEVYDGDNYFGANAQLEIGSNYLRKNEASTATAFSYKANEIYEKLFGDDHPLIQKYYSYACEVASNADDDDMMLSFVKKQVELCERVNKTSDGKTSIFVIDALVTQVSMMSQARANSDEIEKAIERVDMICIENGIVDGSQLQHSAQTMRSMIYIRKEQLKEAEAILEESYLRQVKKFKGVVCHPFLEHSISQLALLYKVNQKLDEAEPMYGNLVKIKELYYGEESESIIPAIKSLASVQAVAKKYQEALENYDRAINIANKLLEQKKVKDRQALYKSILEIQGFQYSILETEAKYEESKIIAIKQAEVSKLAFGEKSAQYAHALFLSAKSKMMTQSDPKETLQIVNKCIEIEEELQKNQSVKNSVIGRYYYCAGTLCQGSQNYKEALKNFKKAEEILGQTEGMQALAEELANQIQSCQMLVGGDESETEEGLKVSQSQSSDNFIMDILVAGAITTILVGAGAFLYLKSRKD